MSPLPSLPDKEFFTLEELAERWKTDRDTLVHWGKAGLLKVSFRFGAEGLFPGAMGKKLPPKITTSSVVTRDERDRFEAEYQLGPNATNPPKNPGDPRERRALLNIIGAMLELMKSPRPGRDTDTAVIAELLDNWPEKYGISDRNLKAKFAEAKRSLNEDD